MIETLQESLQESDLQLINNKYTLKEYTADQIFTFKAKLIDDVPTSNGRIWSKDWMKDTVQRGLFEGAPVVIDHEPSQRHLLGRIYKTELRENAVYGSVYVPLDTEVGRMAETNIKSGLFKSISVNAIASTIQEGQYKRVVPDNVTRIMEVSFVAAPGCKTCGVVKESAEIKETTSSQSGCGCRENSRLTEYAAAVYDEEKSSFVKAAARLLGTSIPKATYQQIAESLQPLQMRQLMKDFHAACSHKETAGTSTVDEPATLLTKQIETIKNMRG